MLRAGFPIPPGFVIDISAFVGHFGEVTDPLVRPKTPLLQTELMAEVMQALMDILGHEEQVAVRSSSTEEDGSHASFAGQHSTYYFVPPNHIDEAIIDCWMSLWSPAALAYRRAGWTHVVSGEPVRMAIIVQQMLPANRSGVAFSCDPVRATSNDTVIEASWGLGAALVDGRVTPDHIRVDATEVVSSYIVSDKQYQVSPILSNHSGQRLQEVPRHQREAKVLSDDEACRIANLSVQLETLFEAPQDVEWAYVGGDLFILQSRSITSRLSRHNIDQRLVLFKPIAENFTEPLTPLSEDLYAKVLPRLGAFVEGRIYLDLDQIQRISPVEVSQQDLINVALLKAMPENFKISWQKLISVGLLMSTAFLVDGANWIRTSRASQSALARYTKLIGEVKKNTNYSIADTMQRLVWGRHFFEPIGHQMLYANVSAGRYFIYIGILKTCVQRWLPDYPIDQLSRTYHGREDMHSMALLYQLDDLSIALQQALEEEDSLSETITELIEGRRFDLPPESAFTPALEKFLNLYGHRGPREMELAAPSWREAPASLLAIIKHHEPMLQRRTQTHGAHLAARDELNQQLKPWQRSLTRYLHGKISHFISLREDTRHFHIMAFDAVRQKILHTEQELVRHDKLKISGDIFFLTHVEIEQLRENKLKPADAHQLIRIRRRTWQQQARTPALETINVEPEHLPPPDAALTGQCACPGTVEGIARVLHSLSDAHTLEAGEILIAPYTDPAWTPLFARASAIVVGTGSFLSHAGTVARELQVPCIVDVKQCTELLKSGDHLRIDASQGIVEVLC